ncbi:MAG: HAMP domain-containing histidine kinase [Clostridia bacterium]|nr:HAMP domain-containing histidine kinase [Clostridia bacterium]
MKLIKGKKGAFFFKYFMIFSSIVLVSFIVVGTSFMLLITNTLLNKVTADTKNTASNLAQMTCELFAADVTRDNPQAAVITMCKNIEFITRSKGYDAFICNKDGEVIVCSETLDEFSVSEKTICEEHGSIKISPLLIKRVMNGEFNEFSKLNGVYDTYYSVCMSPLYLDDSFIGFCVVSAPIKDNMITNVEKVFVMFVLSAAVALLLVTVAVSFMTERIAKPIRNLEAATKCYSSGDFSYRVPELKSNDELANLVTKFNTMATSLSQIENSRRSFVANVSHEFKTPMTTIGGFINGILDGTIPPEKQDYYLKIVSSEINRLSKMVTTMLNISKIETGNVDMNIEQFDIAPKLVTTFLGFEQLISQKNIEIAGFEDLQSATIHGDSAMIDQVIYNLADNAVKFTNEGGTITVKTTSDKNYTYLAITNTGKGIPANEIDKVFERFYKVDQSRSTDVKSTGLGLYLIKSIIDLHNGSITVESEVDSFTRFTVKLPK